MTCAVLSFIVTAAHMSVSITSGGGVRLVGFHKMTGALLFGVYVRALDFCNLPCTNVVLWVALGSISFCYLTWGAFLRVKTTAKMAVSKNHRHLMRTQTNRIPDTRTSKLGLGSFRGAEMALPRRSCVPVFLCLQLHLMESQRPTRSRGPQKKHGQRAA